MLNTYFLAKGGLNKFWAAHNQGEFFYEKSFDFNFAVSRLVGLISQNKIIFAKVPHWGLPQNLAHYPLPTMWRLRRQVWDFRRKLCNAIG